jgi:opacity protein-like surface antigen
MRTFISTVAMTLLSAAAFAQTATPRAYVAGTAGVAVGADGSSGNLLGEVGVRVAPHVAVFGNLGQFHNLEPSDTPPSVDSLQTSGLSSDGLDVKASARVPATYSVGGVRISGTERHRIVPYLLGGAGVAHIEPQATFTVIDGGLDGESLSPGSDVTSKLITLGLFQRPAASNEWLYSAGAGANVLLDRHLVVDGGYRYDHVSGDTPLHSQSVTFGLGYRF